MAQVAVKLRAGARRAASAVAPSTMQSLGDVPALRKRIARLTRRVTALEDERRRHARRVDNLTKRIEQLDEELQQSRRLHQRVAELVDVVSELLLPAMDRDDDRVRRAIEEFSRVPA